jgi:hypothetical protein
MIVHPLHAFLAGIGTDGRGRRIEEILAYPDDALEVVHDYIQWLFPLPTRSMAQPDAPVLTPEAVAAIKIDEHALANLRRAAARMRKFYDRTDGWLCFNDHNHLRISRIVASLRMLAGEEEARSFYEAVTLRHAAASSPINPHNLRYWQRALEA